MQPIAVDFNELLDRILQSIGQMPEFDKVDLKVNIEANADFYGDINILTTIFQNLLTNSIKYQDRDKEYRFCRVEVSVNENGANISISDNGIGFSEDAREQAFRMFYRGSNQSEGSGLGLFIVMSSIRKAQGKIELDSELMKGSTFKIYLPNQKMEKEKAA